VIAARLGGALAAAILLVQTVGARAGVRTRRPRASRPVRDRRRGAAREAPRRPFVGREDVVRHDRLLDDAAIDTLLPTYLDVPPVAGR
jgi:hypothetical protein